MREEEGLSRERLYRQQVVLSGLTQMTRQEARHSANGKRVSAKVITRSQLPRAGRNPRAMRYINVLWVDRETVRIMGAQAHRAHLLIEPLDDGPGLYRVTSPEDLQVLVRRFRFVQRPHETEFTPTDQYHARSARYDFDDFSYDEAEPGDT